MKYEQDVTQPDLKSGEPEEIWSKFFSEHRPQPRLVSEWVMKLHQEKQYKQVIACLQAALIAGQSQPWMYEVLALTMELERYPKEAVERVILSMSDFGEPDFGSMMYSGAYLTRLGRKSAALTMYRQAARILPERPEPYILGLKLAKDSGQPDDVSWAAVGILQNYWKSDYVEKQKAAESAMLNEIQKARRANQSELAQSLQAALDDAKSFDISIRLEWSGAADLDMQIEEPSGTVCSFDNPETQSGGIFLHDGVGPSASETYELYHCPRGIAGPYRILVRNSAGALVGNRATLTVTMREGLPGKTRFVRNLVIEGDEVGLTVELPQGRRTQPRAVSLREEPLSRVEEAALIRGNINRKSGQNVAAGVGSNQIREGENGSTIRRAGAIGYAPVIDVIPEGTTMSAQAIVSPDRRYIRLGVQPSFTEVTDIFTFTFQNGGGR